MLGGVVGLLDQRMHITVPRYTLGVGVFGKLTEAHTEGLVGLVGEPLTTQVDHLVTEQGVPDLPKLRVRHFRSLYTTDFRAHGGRQRPYLDEFVGGGMIVKFAGRMQSHATYLSI